MRSFRVRLPSGSCYWTVVDGEYRVVGEADEYLRHLRFARDSAESTTAAYATAVALYLTWCQTTGRDWRVGASRLGAFILWLRHVPPGSNQIRLAGAVRGNRRINAVLAAVREFLRYGVTVGSVPAEVLGMLYELGDDRDFPDEFRGEGASVKLLARPRHRLSATTSEVARATDAEAVALLEACRNARDRFLVLLLARAGLRRSETVALRRADVHFMSDSTGLGCFLAGEHLHVVRRDPAPNAAYPKSRRSRAVPADRLLVQAFDHYVWERDGCPQAADSDFLLVNLFREPRAAGMRPGAVNELLVSLSRRAGLDRLIRPHMLRHAFATNILEAGGTVDEAQRLLGHASPHSTGIYLHPSHERLRAAVDRVSGRSGDG